MGPSAAHAAEGLDYAAAEGCPSEAEWAARAARDDGAGRYGADARSLRVAEDFTDSFSKVPKPFPESVTPCLVSFVGAVTAAASTAQHSTKGAVELVARVDGAN